MVIVVVLELGLTSFRAQTALQDDKHRRRAILEKGRRARRPAQRYGLAVAEIFGIFDGVAKVVVDQDGGLAG